MAFVAAVVAFAGLGAIGAAPTSAHHSGTCDVYSPMVQQQWGCAKHGRTSSTFGYIQLDDTHTNGKGLYAYAVFSGDTGSPSRWSWSASWGGDKRTFWFSRSEAIHWIAYCDGPKWSNGANCILKGW